MDDIDRRLLLLLTKDARASAADLGRALKVSRGTINNRIEKMMRVGIIERFSVDIGRGEKESQISAFALVHLNADDDSVVKSSLRRIEEVTEVSTLSGAFDLVIELRCASLDRLDTVLDKIRKLPDVADTQSHIRLRSWNYANK